MDNSVTAEGEAKGDPLKPTDGCIARDENLGKSLEDPVLQGSSDECKNINPIIKIEQVNTPVTVSKTVCKDEVCSEGSENSADTSKNKSLKNENGQDSIESPPPRIEGAPPGDQTNKTEVDKNLLENTPKIKNERTELSSRNQESSDGVKTVDAIENGHAGIEEKGMNLKTEEINGGGSSEITEGVLEGRGTSSDEQMDTTMSHQECQDAKEDTSAKDVTLADDKKLPSTSWRTKRSRYRKTRSIVCYSSSSTSTEDIDTDTSQHEETEEHPIPVTRPKNLGLVAKRPLQASSSDESEPDKDSLLSLSSFDSNSDSEKEEVMPKPVKASSSSAGNNKACGKPKAEIYDDLPPIEDLHITVKKEECIPVGTVYSIVNSIVVVESLLGTPPLNLDSVLFKEDGESVGRIFDVFGPVSRPFYALRFTNEDNLKSKGIDHGVTVYCAPQTEHTAYVFTYQLLREKGSDASWKHDEEPPPECLDYSDDEQEMVAKKNVKQAKLNKSKPSEPGAPTTKRFSVNRVFENQPIEGQQSRINNSNLRDPVPLSGNAWQSDDDVGWHNRRQPVMNQQEPAVLHLWAPPPPVFCPTRPPPPLPSQPCPLHYCQQQPSLPIPSPPPHRFGCPPTFQVAPQARFMRPPPTFYRPTM